MAPSIRWSPGSTDEARLPATSSQAHGDAADLRKTQMGQLQLRVRERLQCHSPAPPAATADAPSNAGDHKAAPRLDAVQRLIAAAQGRSAHGPQVGHGPQQVGAPTGDLPASARRQPIQPIASRRLRPACSPARPPGPTPVTAAMRVSVKRLLDAAAEGGSSSTGASAGPRVALLSARQLSGSKQSRLLDTSGTTVAMPVRQAQLRPRRPIRARHHPALRRSFLPPLPACSPELPALVRITAEVSEQLDVVLPAPPVMPPCHGCHGPTTPGDHRARARARTASPSVRRVRARLPVGA